MCFICESGGGGDGADVCFGVSEEGGGGGLCRKL